MLFRIVPIANSLRRLRHRSAGPIFVALGALAAPAGAQTIFTYSGATTAYIVPTGVTSVFVQLWGAGGGSFENSGGGGAYVQGDLAVTPNETLTILVGGGGGGGTPPGSEGGGGFGGGASGSQGGGGGRTAIIVAGADAVDAGAGGGDSYDNNGGAGGLSTGQAGGGAGGGGGGTQSAGGQAGAYPGGMDGYEGNPGQLYQGGSDRSSGGAGGGGAGYYGGGGGGYSTLDNGFGGGGGGSSYTSNLINLVGQAGNGNTPGGAAAPNYIAGVGVGGSSSDGGDGELSITPSSSPAPGSLPIFAALSGVGRIWLRRRPSERRGGPPCRVGAAK